MINAEKYKEKLLEITKDDNGFFAVDLRLNKVVPCSYPTCNICLFGTNNCEEKRLKWLFSEYKEQKICIPPDTPIDTKVLVSDDGVDWLKKYYAGRINGKYWTWGNGRTSWSAHTENDITHWDYMRLAEEEEVNKND